MFSPLILHCKISGERACARVKKLRILLRFNLDNKKSLATALGVLCLAVLLWGMSPEVVSAQAAAGIGLKILGWAGEIVIPPFLFLLALYIIRSILTVALGIAGGLLDFVFVLNTTVNPGQLMIVRDGWTLLRDLSNGIFILLVLWIAITIIFNLEGLGGKRLLVRVIMVALLINFSLVLVSTVFAFGNELAKPFAKAMKVFPDCAVVTSSNCKPPETTLSALIIQNTRITSVLDVIVDKGALQSSAETLKKLREQTISTQARTTDSLFPWWALQAASSPAIGLLNTTTFITGIADIVGVNAYFKWVVNLAIADGILLITTMGVLTAAVVLFLRIFAMVFLGVSAPIAFLGIAFPKYGQRFWTQWTDQLIRWTFTAPIFYFLLYLSLRMLQTNQSGNEEFLKNQTITTSLFMILNLVLFLIFLWMSVYITKKTAGHFADVALSLGRKGLGFGLGVATGFVAKRALPKLGQWSEKGGEAIGKVENPFLRGMLRTPSKILRRTATAGRKQVLEAQGRVGSMTSAEIQRAIGAGEFGEADLAGAMSVLQTRGQITAMPNIKNYGEAQQLAGKNTLRRLGLDFNGFLRANPMLARPEDFSKDDIDTEIREGSAKLGRTIDGTEAAQRLTWSKKVRSENMRTMDLDILDPKNPRAIEQLLEFGSGDHLRELMRFNSAAAGKVQSHLDANPTLYASRVNEKVKKYLENNTAQSFGWRPPPGAVPPTTSGTIIIPPHTGTVATGSPYPTPLSASGGSGTYTWRVRSGSPPPGLTLDPSGRFTGTVSGPRGVTYTFNVEADDGAGNTGTTRVIITTT